jgi:hypothetical protein
MNKTNFANGFNHYCTECGMFFDVKAEPACLPVEYCPVCGKYEYIIDSIYELLEELEDNDTDPVNFYKAFPPDDPIPNSRTGATPRQVEIILDLVVRRKDIPLTAESIAGNCETAKEIVRKVFKELHITEKGGK